MTATAETSTPPEHSANSSVTGHSLLARFAPAFAELSAGAAERDQSREIPLAQIHQLASLGFGALRVPVSHGGSGVSLRELFSLLIELGAADSNAVQALRVHFRFTEDRLAESHTARGKKWLDRIGTGAIVGNASSERAGNIRGRTNTTLRPAGDHYVLNGTKYYSTGSLYADYISVSVIGDDAVPVTALISTSAPGVELLDDYSGFGQRTSASGTSVFTDVKVAREDVIRTERRYAGQVSIVQLVHLATVAGIVRRAVDDTADFVRVRRRSYSQGSADLPREDPLVQQVLGHVDSVAHSVRHIVLGVATELDHVADLRAELHRGDPSTAETAAITEAAVAAELEVFRAQSTIFDLVIQATSRIFEVGGSSALDSSLGLDRHWRNARTLASHNPLVYRDRQIGDYLLNGTPPHNAPSVGEAPPRSDPHT